MYIARTTDSDLLQFANFSLIDFSCSASRRNVHPKIRFFPFVGFLRALTVRNLSQIFPSNLIFTPKSIGLEEWWKWFAIISPILINAKRKMVGKVAKIFQSILSVDQMSVYYIFLINISKVWDRSKLIGGIFENFAVNIGI